MHVRQGGGGATQHVILGLVVDLPAPALDIRYCISHKQARAINEEFKTPAAEMLGRNQMVLYCASCSPRNACLR